MKHDTVIDLEAVVFNEDTSPTSQSQTTKKKTMEDDDNYLE